MSRRYDTQSAAKASDQEAVQRMVLRAFFLTLLVGSREDGHELMGMGSSSLYGEVSLRKEVGGCSPACLSGGVDCLRAGMMMQPKGRASV